MNLRILASVAAISLFCMACSSSGPRNADAPQNTASSTAPADGEARIVKSRNGKFDGEMVGTPRPGSKFAKLEIGMTMEEIQEILGRSPDRFHTYETGKRWIPFYFGNDARRMQAYYKGEGCLVFADGNVFGGGGGEVTIIEHDATGACYQP